MFPFDTFEVYFSSNKVPQTYRLKTIQIYSIIVLKGRSLKMVLRPKSRFQSSRRFEGKPVFLLSAVSGSRSCLHLCPSLSWASRGHASLHTSVSVMMTLLLSSCTHKDPMLFSQNTSNRCSKWPHPHSSEDQTLGTWSWEVGCEGEPTPHPFSSSCIPVPA